jgi:hypothetical protein
MTQRGDPVATHQHRPGAVRGLEEQAQPSRNTHLRGRPAHLVSMPGEGTI